MRKAARALVIKDDALLVMHRNKFGHEYYALIGGSLAVGETAEQALHREVAEESSLTIANPRLVIIEDAGSMYGIQYIYLCDYVSGEPALSASSTEAQITAGGKNLYQPMWLSLQELRNANLQPPELKQPILAGAKDGFPSEPIMLTIRA